MCSRMFSYVHALRVHWCHPYIDSLTVGQGIMWWLKSICEELWWLLWLASRKVGLNLPHKTKKKELEIQLLVSQEMDSYLSCNFEEDKGIELWIKHWDQPVPARKTERLRGQNQEGITNKAQTEYTCAWACRIDARMTCRVGRASSWTIYTDYSDTI